MLLLFFLRTLDPVMTVSADSSGVSFNNCGFSNIDTGTCVIQVNMTRARYLLSKAVSDRLTGNDDTVQTAFPLFLSL